GSLWHQDGEFLAAVAANDINFTKLLHKNIRDLSQHLVAQQMSELVIQALTIIDVDHNHGHAALIARGPFDFRRDLHLEVAAIVDAGEAVHVRQLLRLFKMVRILDRGRADVGHGLQGRNIFLRKVSGFRALQREHAELLAKEDERHAHLRASLNKAGDVVRHERDLVLDDRLSYFQRARARTGARRQQRTLRKDRRQLAFVRAHRESGLLITEQNDYVIHREMLQH